MQNLDIIIICFTIVPRVLSHRPVPPKDGSFSKAPHLKLNSQSLSFQASQYCLEVMKKKMVASFHNLAKLESYMLGLSLHCLVIYGNINTAIHYKLIQERV